jgi:ABC transporter transmembrane region
MRTRPSGSSAARSFSLVRLNSGLIYDIVEKCVFFGTADGAARIGATMFGELLNAVFANVGQRAVRTVARQTFGHLLNLDLKFHLSRQTGGLTRAIDRGTKSVFFPFVFAGPELALLQRCHVHIAVNIVPRGTDSA